MSIPAGCSLITDGQRAYAHLDRQDGRGIGTTTSGIGVLAVILDELRSRTSRLNECKTALVTADLTVTAECLIGWRMCETS